MRAPARQRLAVASHQHDRQVWPALANRAAQVQAGHPVVEGDVGHQHIRRPARFEGREGRCRVPGPGHGIADPRKHGLSDFGDLRVVLHQHHVAALVLGLDCALRVEADGYGLAAGKIERHRHALPAPAPDGDGAAGLPGEAIDLAQPQACALSGRLRREEGLEDLRQLVRRDADAGVGDGHGHEFAGQSGPVVPALPERHIDGRHGQPAAVGHGVAGVHSKVDQGHLERAGIGVHRPDVRRNVETDVDVVLHRLAQKRPQLLDALLQQEAHRLVRAAPPKRQQLAGQGLAALAGREDGVDQSRGALVAHPPFEQLGAALHDHQEVVEVVGDSSGDPAKPLEPAALLQRGRFLLPEPQLAQQQQHEQDHDHQAGRGAHAHQRQCAPERRLVVCLWHGHVHRPARAGKDPVCDHQRRPVCAHCAVEAGRTAGHCGAAFRRCRSARHIGPAGPGHDPERSIDDPRPPAGGQLARQKQVADGVGFHHGVEHIDDPAVPDHWREDHERRPKPRRRKDLSDHRQAGSDRLGLA